MKRLSLALLMMLFWLGLSACGMKQEKAAPAAAPAPAGAPLAKPAADAARMAVGGAAQERAAAGGSADKAAAAGQDAAVPRYIALRHQLRLEMAAPQLKPAYEDLVKRCTLPQCELLSANYTRETDGNPPAAGLEMRLQPALADGFIASLSQTATVIAHNRSSEDRTDQVIDVEAQQKNLVQLRDQLRAMLSQRQGSLKDTLDVQRELAGTQARLDSLAGMRKALANETEKVAVSVEIVSRREPLTRQVWSPLREAWQGMGEVAASSLASMITFVAAILPWMLVLVPLGWFMRRMWRRRAR